MSNDKRVLALKYRPKLFEDLIGQSTISQTLSLALDSDRLSHAYLFSGLRGSGKTSTARIMAKALLCEKGPTSKPCGVCSHCISTASNRHLDVIEMDAASNRGIDDIKELIEHTKYKPSSAKYKIFIIDEVHMLTTQAFNALLKTLEEPPAFVKFILATTDPLKLPATILSRTQHFRFKKIAHKDIVNHLIHILNQENVDFEVTALDILARSGSGSLRDTLTLLDQAIIFSKNKITTSAVTAMLGLIDPQVMDELFNHISKGCDIAPLVQIFADYETGALLDEMSIYLKNKMLENDYRFNMVIFDRFFRIIGESKQLLALNSDGEFVLALTFMKMIEAKKLKTLDEIMDEVAKNETFTNTSEQKSVVMPTVKNDIVQSTQSQPTKPLFEQLIDRISERSDDVGRCFSENIEFVSFENGVLKWISYADGDDKVILHRSFSFIKRFVYDIFGENTSIDFQKGEKKNDIEQGRIEQASPEDEENSSSMIEDIEMGGGGCVANLLQSKDLKPSSKELQINDILESQMVQTIETLFKPTYPFVVKSRV